MDKKVKNLLQIIKYTPPLIVILACIFIISLIYQEQKIELNKEKIFVETEYIEGEKSAIVANVNTIYNYIKNEKLTAEEILRKDLKSKINNAYQITSNIYDKNKNNYSKSAIIKQIKNAIEIIRFNEGRAYFSIYTMEGVNILEPVNRELEGTSLLNKKDSKGNYPIRQIIEVLKTKDESFLDWYYFKEKDNLQESKKIELVRKFEPYNLIITTSVYLDEYEENLKKKILKHISKIKYKNDGYAFLIDFNGQVLLHHSKRVLNHNIFKEKMFSHMNGYFKKLIDKESKDSAEFISLKPKVIDNKDTKETKIVFSKRFDDWNWIISTSFKLSDATKIIEKRKINLEKKYDSYKKYVLLYGLLFTLALLLISFFVARLIEKKLLDYKKDLENQISENVNQKENLVKAQQIANIGDWRLDLQTYKASWSDEFTKMFGVSNIKKENFGPEYIKTLIFKEDVSFFEDSLHKCITTGAEHNCIYRIKRPDNEIKWINCRGEINKEKTFMMGTVQDITRSKKLELEKKQQEDILHQQSKLAAMGEMLGNIAHQWRQPLSTISTGATGAKLQKEMNLLSDKDFNNTMDSINSSAQYLSETIEDFSSFFDMKNNVKTKFLISDAIGKTLNLISSQFTAKQILIIKNIEDISVESIENELIQVLVNILNNSRDALLKVDDQKRFIFIDVFEKENKLVIEIKDNANGISNDILDRIFEPYFTTKHKSQGTGIGLYMSKNIINTYLEGSITVENEIFDYDGIEYKGASFTISIPK